MRRLLILLLLIAAPAWAGEAERMYRLAARTTLLASAVHFTALSNKVPADLDGDDLIARATALNPSMLDDFNGYYVAAHRVGKASAVLVCDKRRTVALIEDAGCTEAVDAHRWQDKPRPSCAFALDPVAVCD